MKDSEILKAVIEKAEKNGYIKGVDNETTLRGIIFSHDFAKAFWGGTSKNSVPIWKYNLQKLVLEEDKLQYLKQFI